MYTKELITNFLTLNLEKKTNVSLYFYQSEHDINDCCPDYIQELKKKTNGINSLDFGVDKNKFIEKKSKLTKNTIIYILWHGGIEAANNKLNKRKMSYVGREIVN